MFSEVAAPLCIPGPHGSDFCLLLGLSSPAGHGNILSFVLRFGYMFLNLGRSRLYLFSPPSWADLFTLRNKHYRDRGQSKCTNPTEERGLERRPSDCMVIRDWELIRWDYKGRSEPHRARVRSFEFIPSVVENHRNILSRESDMIDFEI